jgi:hypothetical protein
MTIFCRSQWRQLDCWDQGFESRWEHGCLSVVFAVCCVGSGPYDEVIARPVDSYGLSSCASHVVWSRATIILSTYNRIVRKTKSLLKNICAISLLAQRGPGPPDNTPWPVGLLWTGDRFVAETSTWQHTQNSNETHIHASGGIFSLSLSLSVLYTYFFCPDCPGFAFYPYCTTHTTQTSRPPAGFEPAIPASDRLQTFALDWDGHCVVEINICMYYINCFGYEILRYMTAWKERAKIRP